MRLRLSVLSLLIAWSVSSVVAQCQEYFDHSADPCIGSASACFPEKNPARWTAAVDALFMNRMDYSSAVLGVNTANAGQAINASDLDFGFHSGFEAAVQHKTSDGDMFELKYFGIEDWDAGVTTATTPGDLLQINTVVPTFVTAGTAMTAHHTSSLHNAEFNFSRPMYDRIELLVGFRYLELDESGRLGLVGAGVPAELTSNTTNRLYGFQAGGDVSLFSSKRFSLDMLAKAGVFGNNASQDGTLVSGLGTLNSGDSNSVVSFLGELDLSAKYRFSDSLSLRCGYRLMALDNVATAGDQFGGADFISGTGLNSSDNVFYHGVHVGLMFSY